MFQLVTPPVGSLISLEEIKADLRIDGDDFDSELPSWIASAIEKLQDEARLQFLTATWTLYRSSFPQRELPIWKAPVQSVESIEYVNPHGELQGIDPEDCRLSDRDWPRIVTPQLGTRWPRTAMLPDAVRVTFRAGYGEATAVPEFAKGVLKLMVRGMFHGCSLDLEPHLNHLRWTNQRETEI